MKKYYFREFSNTIIYRSEMIILIAFRQLISARMTKISTLLLHMYIQRVSTNLAIYIYILVLKFSD